MFIKWFAKRPARAIDLDDKMQWAVSPVHTFSSRDENASTKTALQQRKAWQRCEN